MLASATSDKLNGSDFGLALIFLYFFDIYLAAIPADLFLDYEEAVFGFFISTTIGSGLAALFLFL